MSMLIAQISDTHISIAGQRAYGIAPMAENLARCIEHINQQVPRPDVVLVTGDISYEGRIKELEHAERLFDKLHMPYFIIAGNHDDRDKLLTVFSAPSCPVAAGSFIQYVIDQYDIRLIALDSIVPGESGGQICKERASWLDMKLAEDVDKPTLLFMHHPPIKCGVIETDIDGFDGSQRLGDVVEKYTNIEAILCGHIHTPAHTRWRGTVVSTAPSMGMRLLLDLTLKREAFYNEEPAYQLHYWTEEQNLISHYVSVRDSDGPYPFKEQ